MEWAFDPSGFRRGAKCCMGAPRGNDFLFAPLGAGRQVAVESKAPVMMMKMMTMTATVTTMMMVVVTTLAVR